MTANLPIEATWLVPVAALAAATISSITRSVVSLFQTMVMERSRTTRFLAALNDCTPHQRAEIIRACGHLEAAPARQSSRRDFS